MVEFFFLFRWGLFLFSLEVDLNENAIVETWIKIIIASLDNREISLCYPVYFTNLFSLYRLYQSPVVFSWFR